MVHLITLKRNLPISQQVSFCFSQIKLLELFGSGWTWLVAPKGRGADGLKELKIISTNNAGSPFRHFPEYCALMVLDVWEHAYYLDYKNERVKFIDGFWGIVNWDFASERLTKALHEGNCNLD